MRVSVLSQNEAEESMTPWNVETLLFMVLTNFMFWDFSMTSPIKTRICKPLSYFCLWFRSGVLYVPAIMQEKLQQTQPNIVVRPAIITKIETQKLKICNDFRGTTIFWCVITFNNRMLIFKAY